MADTPEKTPVVKAPSGLVKWVSSWGAGARIAVGVALLFACAMVNQQNTAQPPGSSPGLLPALTADLALVLGVALIVSGVVKWWRQRRGTPIQPSTPAVSYADPRNEERLRHSDETVHREAHEMVNGAAYCPSCGNASQHEDRFCRSCGAPSAPRPVPPSSLVAQAGAAQRSETETLLAREQTRPTRQSNRLVLGVLGLALALGATGIFVVTRNSDIGGGSAGRAAQGSVAAATTPTTSLRDEAGNQLAAAFDRRNVALSAIPWYGRITGVSDPRLTAWADQMSQVWTRYQNDLLAITFPTDAKPNADQLVRDVAGLVAAFRDEAAGLSYGVDEVIARSPKVNTSAQLLVADLGHKISTPGQPNPT